MAGPPEAVCLELLFITVFLWAAIWGLLDLAAQRLESDGHRAAFYAGLFAAAALLVAATPGVNACRVL